MTARKMAIAPPLVSEWFTYITTDGGAGRGFDYTIAPLGALTFNARPIEPDSKSSVVTKLRKNMSPRMVKP